MDIKHFFERGEGFKAAGRNTELDHVESAQPVKNAKSSSMKTSANASRSSPILSAIVSLNGPDPNGVQTRLSTAFCNNGKALFAPTRCNLQKLKLTNLLDSSG